MGHDIHFLERLERLSPEQVEVALALYRDSGLVQSLLRKLELPDSAECVAISLDDERDGPFVIVTRQGRFVTCLGRNMRVSASKTPVVSKERFDAVAGRVHHVREMVDEISKQPRREIERVLSRLVLGGSEVSREDFLAVAPWSPLIGVPLLDTFMRTAARLARSYGRLSRRQGFKRRDEAALRGYWQDCWALGHIGLLLGVDGGELLRDALGRPALGEELGRHLTWSMVRLGVLPMAARGAWLASKVGKVLIPAYKQMYRQPVYEHQLLNAGFCLSAIGYSHRRSRAEIGKLLGQTTLREPGPLGELFQLMRKTVAWHYEMGAKELDQAEARMEDLARALHESDSVVDASEGGPPPASSDVEIADLLNTPFPLLSRDGGLLEMFLYQLPWVAQAKPEAFYLPQAYLEPQAWTPQRSLTLIAPRRQWEPPASGSVRAPSLPGRNDPCHCGSGEKFKRCCSVVATPRRGAGLALAASC